MAYKSYKWGWSDHYLHPVGWSSKWSLNLGTAHACCSLLATFPLYSQDGSTAAWSNTGSCGRFFATKKHRLLAPLVDPSGSTSWWGSLSPPETTVNHDVLRYMTILRFRGAFTPLDIYLSFAHSLPRATKTYLTKSLGTSRPLWHSILLIG